jgi:hypothetical protein
MEDDPGSMEIWLHAFAIPGRVAELARWAEPSGFTGLLIADSQNLTADIWVELALAGPAPPLCGSVRVLLTRAPATSR